MPKLSIIVTVYNGEAFLQKCLQSLHNQTFTDYEIICIDDGSDDSSLEILQKEGRNNSKIRVVHQENRGVWFARKRGIELAAGDWLGFVDCDDTVSKDMYQTLVGLGEAEPEIDMVVCGFNKVDAQTGEVYARQMRSFGKQIKDTRKGMGGGIFIAVNPSMCNKLFRREVCEQAIELAEAPRIMEDFIFTASILPLIKKVAFTDELFYQYYDRKGSVTKKIGHEDVEKAKEALLNLKMFWTEKYEDRDLLNALAFLHLGVAMTINYNQITDKSDLKKVWKEIILYFNSNFPEWRTNLYFTWKYYKNNYWIAKYYYVYLIFRTYLYLLAIRAYHFMMEYLHVDIKW